MKIKKYSILAALALSASAVNAATFIIEKNDTGFSIDGNNGAIEGQQIYLWETDTSNENQQWVQISHGDGYYSYKKYGTNLCWDGGDGGENGQAVTLETCDSSNYDQHWSKIKIYSGTEIYRFEKRNAPGYSLDGNNGYDYRQAIYLWSSDSDNVNQQWDLTNLNDVSSTTSDDSSSDYGLDADAAPSENFELIDWYLSIPVKDDDDYATSIMESDLDAGYEDDYFYTGSDGGMVFYTPGDGVTTSSGTKYVRTELREMLRRGDTDYSTTGTENNWAFSSISSSDQDDFGGIDGVLNATLAVNHVTTTGSSDSKNGRIVIGQIHAEGNEPLRLYYHKLPDNTNGAIYMAHETSESDGGDETFYNLLGDMVDSDGDVDDSSNPSDGIALDETFSYQVTVEGDDLTVVISQDGTQLAEQYVDMSDSGYDDADNYMFFKAGIYLQDNTCDDDDYAKVTFYVLNNSHDNYDY